MARSSVIVRERQGNHASPDGREGERVGTCSAGGWRWDSTVKNRTKAERYIPYRGLKKPGGIGRTQYSSDAQAGRCVVVAFWKMYRGWGVISPVAGEPAARDRCRGGCTGADTETSVFRHVLSAASDQGAGTPFEASEPTRPMREFIIACGLAAYGKRRASDQTN